MNSKNASRKKGRSTIRVVRKNSYNSRALHGAGLCVNSQAVAKKRSCSIKRYKGGKLDRKKPVRATFQAAVRAAKSAAQKSKIKDLRKIAQQSLIAAKKYYKGAKNKISTLPLVIALPKKGGFLPLLIPIFSALAAAGGLAGGLSGVVSAVNRVKSAQKQSDEAKHHNESMEAIALRGRGMYVQPYKEGLGIYNEKKKTIKHCAHEGTDR
jgi:hypothetical protein